MITLKVDDRLLQARLLQVAKGVKGGLRKAVADSAGRIGLSVAKSTYPRTKEQGEIAVKRDIAKVWPGNGYFVNELKSKGGPKAVGIFFNLLEKGQLRQAEEFARKTMATSRFKIADRANPSDQWSQRYPSNGRVRRNPVRVWLLDDKGKGSPSLAGRTKSLLRRVGSVANGWVTASRYFRTSRGLEGLPRFKAKTQKRPTGSGVWEGSTSQPVAVLINNFSFADKVMQSGSFAYAMRVEAKKLESQIKAQARAAFRGGRR